MDAVAYLDLNSTSFKGIDVYPVSASQYDNLFPLLKCEDPCLTCLDTDPKYCLSCWGRDTPVDEGVFTKYFLQPATPANDMRATCAPTCDAGFTTNGGIADATDE